MSLHRLMFLVFSGVLTSSSIAQGPVSGQTRESAPASAPIMETATIQPPRVALLQGTAILARNRPVAGATVLVRATSRVGDLYLTSTDAKGAFRLDDVPDGAYDVEFLRDGLLPIRKDKVDVRSPFRSIVEVTMKTSTGTAPAAARAGGTAAQAPGSLKLHGSVGGRDGRPMSDVPIRLVRRDAAMDPREARTGPDGLFEVDGLAPGEFTLESRGLGVLPVRADLRLDASARIRLVLVPQPTLYEPSPVDLAPPEEPIPPPAS